MRPKRAAQLLERPHETAACELRFACERDALLRNRFEQVVPRQRDREQRACIGARNAGKRRAQQLARFFVGTARGVPDGVAYERREPRTHPAGTFRHRATSKLRDALRGTLSPKVEGSELMEKIVVGVSGASGSAYALAALHALRARGDVEIHLILSAQAKRTIELETDSTAADFEALAHVVHRDDDLGASVSSGSFLTAGMLVIPCSMKTASGIAYSFNANLLVRAADVCLKERRRLVLVVRETPLHLGHLHTLTRLAEIGAVILPPVPAMYAKPQSVDDIIAHTVGKALDQFGIPNDLFKRWS